MLIFVMTAMAQKTFPCSINSWQYNDVKIAQLFKGPVRLSCLLRTQFCITWFSVGFHAHPGHFTFWGTSPIYWLSTSTLSYSSMTSHCQKFWCLDTYQQRINPHNIPCKNIHPNLVPQSTFPFKLKWRKMVSCDGWTLLWDAYISAIYTDEAVFQTATIFPAFKNNLEEMRWV